jgi:hypothetical protein
MTVPALCRLDGVYLLCTSTLPLIYVPPHLILCCIELCLYLFTPLGCALISTATVPHLLQTGNGLSCVRSLSSPCNPSFHSLSFSAFSSLTSSLRLLLQGGWQRALWPSLPKLEGRKACYPQVGPKEMGESCQAGLTGLAGLLPPSTAPERSDPGQPSRAWEGSFPSHLLSPIPLPQDERRRS